MYLNIFVTLVFVIATNGQYEGEQCWINDIEGTCRAMQKCEEAMDDMKKFGNLPHICSFVGSDPIVCCGDGQREEHTTHIIPVVTTTRRHETTTEYVPEENDYVSSDQGNRIGEGKQCEPLSTKLLTAKKTGQKARDKCIEYQEKILYPCEQGVDILRRLGRGNYCKHKDQDLVVGGVAAKLDEFPHMVSLGFEAYKGNIQWLCGGTLLSERFILTAGHCIFAAGIGKVSYARTSLLRISEPIDQRRLHKIKNIIKHPDYKSPSKYNDIALLETEGDIILDPSAVPACLDVHGKDYTHALATGWGVTEDRGTETADQLQEVILEKFTPDECLETYPPRTRHLVNGSDDTTQICYGHRTESKDTCQGDSGGPLQIYNKEIHCMYTVIGVTSFGNRCGTIGEPAIYTRVSAYVPWIESIVWP